MLPARSGRPRDGIDGELAGPSHPCHDGVATRDVVAHFVGLPGEQRASLLEPCTHGGGVALAAGRVDEVRPLDEADVGSEKLRQLVLRRPAPVECGEESFDDLHVLGRGVV